MNKSRVVLSIEDYLLRKVQYPSTFPIMLFEQFQSTFDYFSESPPGLLNIVPLAKEKRWIRISFRFMIILT